MNANDSKIKDLKCKRERKDTELKRKDVAEKVEIGLVRNGKKESMSIRYFRSGNMKMYK